MIYIILFVFLYFDNAVKKIKRVLFENAKFKQKTEFSLTDLNL